MPPFVLTSLICSLASAFAISGDHAFRTGLDEAGLRMAISATEGDPVMTDSEHAADARYVLGYTMNRIDGEPVKLEDYRGKVILMVNTASRCGLTPQYAGLQKLFEEHKDDGLVILGFPANNFGNQEPGTNEQIAEFCDARYSIGFPMFEKISVRGEDQHPLFKQLSKLSEEPNWNFTKYLIDRDGNFVERFGPRVAPSDEALLGRVRELLASEAGA